MIQATALTADLKKEVTALETDLHRRLKEEPGFAAPLRERYQAAFSSKRTAATFGAWAEGQITQAAVAWVLATVFIRFLEDNRFLPDPILSGPDERRGLAQDALARHFMQHPGDSERDFLLHHFAALRRCPALTELLGPHNALHSLHPSADALRRLLAFWRELDPASGHLRHDFTDAAMNTRFLGDLYQDLSESARKTYALLQTPEFIESFILDRTLTPALREFGLRTVRLIDPTCGSGHFLLGAFRRLFALWQKEVPTAREAAVNALAAVHGVDLNPFAVAISRFRLTIEACHLCGITRLADAPDFHLNLATGDSLLHGRRFVEYGTGIGSQPTLPGSADPAFRDELKHHYEVEDVEALHRILGQQYHAVVGNPPYITVKDKALSELYRARYPSCRGKYSLSVPFMERFFDLAVKGDGTPQQPAGFVGQITSNSFMKREFGKKLIEEYLPRWDLTHVLDTSVANIPGHGTPTVILFGKSQPPVSGTIRTVLGIRGEETTPEDPATAPVWKAIVRQIDDPGSVSKWVSAADSPRASFHRHPWSIGGGGAAELKEQIEEAGEKMIGTVAAEIGITAVTGEDELFVFPSRTDLVRLRIEKTKTLVTGDPVRDWRIQEPPEAVWLYDDKFDLLDLKLLENTARLFWSYRASISRRKRFGTPMVERGLSWYEWQETYPSKLSSPLSIAWPEVATHNHFVFDRDGLVFKNSTPVIKLKSEFTEIDHTRLLGVLNSSTACFYLQQVSHNKGGPGGACSKDEKWHDFYAFNGSKLGSFPIPARQPTQLPTALVKYSTALQAQSPAATLASWGGPGEATLRELLASARDLATSHRRKLIAWQEELDWQIYEAFGLVEGAAESGARAASLPEGAAVDAIPPEGIELGQRAFEIVLARRMAAGEVQTTWFERHGSTPITEIPTHWPAAYRELVERRIQRIADDANIRLIEQPEYKRRWNTEPWDEQWQRAARDWLLLRLETYFYDSERMEPQANDECKMTNDQGSESPGVRHSEFGIRHSWPAGQAPAVFSLAQLAAVAESDAALKAVMEAYTGTPAFDMHRQLKTLLEEASVPYLPVLRYKESGLRKRREWESVWALQRQEDAVEARVLAEAAGKTEAERQALVRERQKAEVGDIPVPPKYASADFRKSTWWGLRGKLDVPKERWVSYPGLESDAAPSPLYAWAGWNHLQQAQALAALYVQRKDTDGWDAPRLTPILAGLTELVPWLQQWHNEIDPAYGERLGDFYAAFIAEERRALGLTPEDVDRERLG